MTKLAIAFTIVSAVSSSAAYAQQCLHGPNETADQTARRREALTATRTVHNIQHNQPGARDKSFFRHAQLADSPYATSMRTKPGELAKRISFSPDAEILPGWKLTLDVSVDGYWFAIKDTTDPCGFSYMSNTSGLIYTAEPIR